MTGFTVAMSPWHIASFANSKVRCLHDSKVVVGQTWQSTETGYFAQQVTTCKLVLCLPLPLSLSALLNRYWIFWFIMFDQQQHAKLLSPPRSCHRCVHISPARWCWTSVMNKANSSAYHGKIWKLSSNSNNTVFMSPWDRKRWKKWKWHNRCDAHVHWKERHAAQHWGIISRAHLVSCCFKDFAHHVACLDSWPKHQLI